MNLFSSAILSFLLTVQTAVAGEPVIWNGSLAKWLPSGLQSAGVCTLNAQGVMSSTSLAQYRVPYGSAAGSIDQEASFNYDPVADSLQVTSLELGSVPPGYDGKQLWVNAAQGMVRLGSSTGDFDSTDIEGYGFVAYGPNEAGDPMDASNFSMVVVRPGSYSLLNYDSTPGALNGSMYAVGNAFVDYYKDDGSLAVRLTRANGRVLADTFGGVGSFGTNVTLTSNATVTKGKVYLGTANTSAYDEANDRLGIGTASPTVPLDVNGAARVRGLTTAGPVTTDASGNLSSSASLGVTQGGTGTTTQFTQGSVVFAGASGVYSQDNSGLFYDNTNDRLGLGETTPQKKLHLQLSTSGDGIEIEGSSGGANRRWQLNTYSTDTFCIENANSSFFTMCMSNNFGVGIGTAGSLGSMFSVANPSDKIGEVIRGAASQTLDLTQWQNSGGTVLAKVNSSGAGTFAGMTVSTLGAGVAHLNASGVMSSSTIATADIAANAVTNAKLDDFFINDLTQVSVTSLDQIAIADQSDSGKKKKVLVSDIVTLAGGGYSPSSPSSYYYYGGNGHGSTNTKVRRLSTEQTAVGSDITSNGCTGADGCLFTINTTGVYSITYSDQAASGGGGYNWGIAKNPSSYTTSIASLTRSQVLTIQDSNSGQNGFVYPQTITVPLSSGDIIAPMTDGNPGNSTNFVYFSITRVH